jgi:hypothetical protein
MAVLLALTSCGGSEPERRPHRNVPEAPFSANLRAYDGRELSDLAVADFNGDRTPDLALTGSHEAVVLFSRGDGTFRTRVVSREVPDSRDVKAADLNGDRRPDLVTVGFEGVGTTVLINQGAGHSGSTTATCDTAPRIRRCRPT